MPDPHALKRTAPADGAPRRLTCPSSSRMLASYLSDIEQLLEEHRWDQARREAADLPQVAAALADPDLQVSPAAVRHWCEHWLAAEPMEPETGGEAQSTRCLLRSRIESSNVPDQAVPAVALRRLRLHRLARTLPRGFNAGPLAVPDEDAADAVRFCTALVEGTRRWYAQNACHDPTVQANLARLAVLR